jgi:hypothetical protein
MRAVKRSSPLAIILPSEVSMTLLRILMAFHYWRFEETPFHYSIIRKEKLNPWILTIFQSA